jgi:hypothetical protein
MMDTIRNMLSGRKEKLTTLITETMKTQSPTQTKHVELIEKEQKLIFGIREEEHGEF